jgi:hypothetical protein
VLALYARSYSKACLARAESNVLVHPEYGLAAIGISDKLLSQHDDSDSPLAAELPTIVPAADSDAQSSLWPGCLTRC